jgi:hypothetical protein
VFGSCDGLLRGVLLGGGDGREVRIQRTDDRVGRSVGGHYDAMNSVFAQRGGCYRTYRGDCELVLDFAQPLFPYQVGKIMDGGWTKK